MKVIYVDIDETICHRESNTDFGVTLIIQKQNQFKRILIRSINFMMRVTPSYIGPQEVVENRLIGLT